jgi:hypothetical protein
VKLAKKAKFFAIQQVFCDCCGFCAIFLPLVLKQAYLCWDMDSYSTQVKYFYHKNIKIIIDTGVENVTIRVDYKGIIFVLKKSCNQSP